jgi:hypothetical protein
MKVWKALEFLNGTFKCHQSYRIISKLLRMWQITAMFFIIMTVIITIEACADFQYCKLKLKIYIKKL